MSLHILTVTEFQKLQSGKTTVAEILNESYLQEKEQIDKSELSAIELDILESELNN